MVLLWYDQEHILLQMYLYRNVLVFVPDLFFFVFFLQVKVYRFVLVLDA